MGIGKEKLLKVIVKHGGHQTKAAKELNITQSAISKHIKRNPQIQKVILNVREEALKRAGLTRSFVYRGIKQGCLANIIVFADGKANKTKIADHDTRHKYLKTALELHKDLDPDKEQSVQNVAAVIFAVINNPRREVIEVV